MALQPSVGHWPIFHFIDLSAQSVGLLGRGISPSQGRYLAQESTNRINGHKHPCLKWDLNPRSQCLSERRQFMPNKTARPLWSAEWLLAGENLHVNTGLLCLGGWWWNIILVRMQPAPLTCKVGEVANHLKYLGKKIYTITVSTSENLTRTKVALDPGFLGQTPVFCCLIN
jgi:hypothetical protein